MKSPTCRIRQDQPALQHVPLHTEIGEQLREAFTREKLLEQAPPLVDVDYAALEMRVLAQAILHPTE